MRFLKKQKNLKNYDVPNDIKHQKVYELISEKIETIYPEIITLKEKKYLDSKNFNRTKQLRFAAYCFLFLAIILLGVIIFIYFKLSKDINYPIITFFIISTIITIILFILHWQFYRPIKKIIKYFNDSQVISQFYENYTEVFYPKIFINKIDNTIDSIVNSFFPVSGYNKVWNGNILHGRFKETDFTIGTKVYEFRHYTSDHKGNTSVHYEYKEYLYAISYCERFNCEISLKGSKLFKRGRKDLESSEFTKKFSVNYSDDIKARQVLQPKVIAKLLDLEQSNKKVPNITLFNDIILLNQATRTWGEISSKAAYFASLDYYIGTIDQLKKAVMYTIEKDLEIIDNVVKWIEAFNLHRDYDISNLNNKYGEETNDEKSN